MMRYNLLAISVFSFSSVLAQNGVKTGPIKIKYEALLFNGEMAFYKDQPFTGLAYTFWDNKRINEETSFVSGWKDGEYKEFTEESILVTSIFWKEGKKNGPFRYFYPNGAKQSEGGFSDNELDGEIKGFYTNGLPLYENHYTKGIRNGWSKSWFPNGTIEQTTYFVNDLPHGLSTGYYKDSIIRYEMEYTMGVKHGHYYKFHKGGCPAVESYYKNGLLDSVYRAWDELRCQLLEEGYYTNGIKNGVFVQFGFNNKDSLLLQTFKNGKLHGLFKQWKDRELENMGYYSDGELNGYWIYGLSTGFKHREGNYVKNVMVGEWVFYDLEGYLLMKQWYDEDGNITKEKIYKKKRKK